MVTGGVGGVGVSGDSTCGFGSFGLTGGTVSGLGLGITVGSDFTVTNSIRSWCEPVEFMPPPPPPAGPGPPPPTDGSWVKFDDADDWSQDEKKDQCVHE